MAAAEVAALAKMGHLLDLAWQLKTTPSRAAPPHCSNVCECPVWGTLVWSPAAAQVLRTMPRASDRTNH